MLQILADSHVHIHDVFLIDKLLDNALKNFKKYSQKKSEWDCVYFLLLTEIEGKDCFSQILDYAYANKTIGDWKFYATKEISSIYVENKSQDRIYLIAGSQIITSEKLEVLNLISSDRIKDNYSLETTISKIIDCGGLPVLPWGVGKWLGKRGKLINNLLKKYQFPYIFLGDNGSRPWFWLYSPYFELAQKKEIKILPGTDPLSLNSEIKRIGSFGFTVNDNLDLVQPGKSLKETLLNPYIKIETYGNLQEPITFFRNQIAIRI